MVVSDTLLLVCLARPSGTKQIDALYTTLKFYYNIIRIYLFGTLRFGLYFTHTCSLNKVHLIDGGKIIYAYID